MGTLRVSLNHKNKIEIEPIGELSQSDWSSVVSWWGDYSNSIQNTRIEISPAEFSQKKNWLRENWTRLGHKVEVEKGAIDEIKKSEAIVSLFENIANQSFPNSQVSVEHLQLKRSLTNFQLRNFQALVAMPNGANFSVPGAGKTSTTLVVWEYFRKLGTLKQMLVICPRSAFEAWNSEPSIVLVEKIISNNFSDAHIPLETELLYVNFEQLENNERVSRLKRWMHRLPTMLVIDEAHRVKAGPNSVRWRACSELSECASRVDILTGTPMPQDSNDLRNLLSLSWRGIPNNFFSESRLSELKNGGVFVRTTKRELGLPPMRIQFVEVEMGKIQSEIYSALRSTFAGQFAMSESDQSFFRQRGKAVMALLASATNPGLLMTSRNEDAFLGLQWPPLELNGAERLINILENYSIHEIPVKYEWVARFIAKASSEGRKVIIWSTFVGNLIALNKLLKPYSPALIYGATPIDERAKELLRFRNSSSCSVLLSNPQTLGEGVSLHHDCHDAIYLDRSYNAGLYLQSLDRIHRLGLPEQQETNIYILQSESSIDKRISRRLEIKIERLAMYLNDNGLVACSLPSEDNQETSESLLGIDELDLNDLFDHLREK